MNIGSGLIVASIKHFFTLHFVIICMDALRCVYYRRHRRPTQWPPYVCHLAPREPRLALGIAHCQIAFYRSSLMYSCIYRRTQYYVCTVLMHLRFSTNYSEYSSNIEYYVPGTP